MSEVSEEIGSKLLFENDRVKVWDLRLEPGESTGLHRHTNDYLYVVIGDGNLSDRQMEDGTVRWRDVDGEDVHEATNTGSTPWRNIIVELKR